MCVRVSEVLTKVPKYLVLHSCHLQHLHSCDFYPPSLPPSVSSRPDCPFAIHFHFISYVPTDHLSIYLLVDHPAAKAALELWSLFTSRFSCPDVFCATRLALSLPPPVHELSALSAPGPQGDYSIRIILLQLLLTEHCLFLHLFCRIGRLFMLQPHALSLLRHLVCTITYLALRLARAKSLPLPTVSALTRFFDELQIITKGRRA